MLVSSTSMVSFAKSPLHAPAERPLVVLDESDAWMYAGTSIPAVGARDVTLGEAANPQRLAREGEEPEAVVLSLTEIESDSRLHWAFEVGTRLNGAEEPLYKIDWAAWQEHADEPVGAWLPEWDGEGVDRSLARAERQWRFAKQALDDAGVLRQYLVVLAARLGRSRRRVGETLGLSPARIQQLHETAPAGIVADVEEFVRTATRVAAQLGRKVRPRAELSRPEGLGGDEFEEAVDSMIALGLIEEVAKGLSLSKDGKALLAEEGQKRKPAKTDRDREHAGEATR
jgi:hypothetical protein